MNPFSNRKSSKSRYKHYNLMHFPEKNVSANLHTKQRCGFSLEILSMQTVFGKKRVKEGK